MFGYLMFKSTPRTFGPQRHFKYAQLLVEYDQCFSFIFTERTFTARYVDLIVVDSFFGLLVVKERGLTILSSELPPVRELVDVHVLLDFPQVAERTTKPVRVDDVDEVTTHRSR